MSLAPPNAAVPIVGPNGACSIQWYKFLVQLGKSVRTETLSDDVILAGSEPSAEAMQALRLVRDAALLAELPSIDQPKAPDMSLLAWWPGETR